MVFVATIDGQSRLWLRHLNVTAAGPLRGTDGARYPFWSPDSRSIGFFAEGKLKRIDIDGGSVQTLTIAAGGRGGTWNRDGVILFAPLVGSAIFRVAAGGGDAIAVTQLAPQQNAHRFPLFLPDGRHFLYYALSSVPERGGVYIGELGRSESRRLLDSDAAAVYASTGHLLFARQGSVFAQAFDARRFQLTGDPFHVAEQLAVNVADNVAGLSASAAGPLVYRPGGTSGHRQFTWFDRSGRELGKLGGVDTGAPFGVALSPDGRHVAVSRTVIGNTDIWLMDTARGVLSRFTFDAAFEGIAAWSPDGSRIAFNTNRKGAFDLYQKSATGAGSEDLLLETRQLKSPGDWSPDGRFLLFRVQDPKTVYDLWVLPLEGDRKAFPIVQTPFDERDGQFSPDGKWVAYQSNESGRIEIYAQAFPGTGAKFQVSTAGGAQVRWRRDGKELFYIALDDRLMAVPIEIAANGQSVEAGAPVPLFTTHVGGAVQYPYTQQYAVSSDGQRFLMNSVIDEAASPITMILNWTGKKP